MNLHQGFILLRRLWSTILSLEDVVYLEVTMNQFKTKLVMNRLKKKKTWA